MSDRARVREYLEDVERVLEGRPGKAVSLIHFGSSAQAGLAGAAGDVDLLVVLADGSGVGERKWVEERVRELEIGYGFRARVEEKGLLERMVEGAMASDHSFFVCERSDLLSGLPGRVMHLHPAQAALVDRIVMRGILASAVTVWGEDLVRQVKCPPLRRMDVGIAFFGLFSQALTSLCWYPLLPGATKYAMATLKHSVRSCSYFARGRQGDLAEDVAYLQEQGRIGALEEMLELRRAYRPSWGFVARCLPALVRLHWRTAQLLAKG